MKTSIWKNRLIFTASTLVFITVWKIASVFLGAQIILPAPETVVSDLVSLVRSGSFLENVLSTAGRGVVSFLIALVFGVAAGAAAGLSDSFYSVLKPALNVIRATPIMSVILLAIVWFKSGTVPVFAAFLISFPVVVQNTVAGIRETDKKLLEMADAFGLGRRDTLLHISIPSLAPFVLSGARTALGLTWKVIAAGEVLSLPESGIGSRMQYAQISLETSTVFAWTIIAVVLSVMSQFLLDLVSKFLERKRYVSAGL